MSIKDFLKQWRFTLILLLSVAGGSWLGYAWGPKAAVLKPFGDVFLNILFTAAVPLVFFSLSSAVGSSSNPRRLGRIAIWMLVVFLITGIISSYLMVFAVGIFNPVGTISLQLGQAVERPAESLAQSLVNTFTVNDFSAVLSRQNMLALIVFSVLVGFAAQAAGEKGRAFRDFLSSGAEVMGRLIKLIIYYAPIGLGAYFAYMMGSFGEQLLKTYANSLKLYYPLSLAYFFVGFSVYALLSGGIRGFGLFWKHIPPAALTAFGTCSSLAALPVNLESARRIGVPEDVREIVLPLGATIHMDGTCLGAILKIAILFALYGRPFTGVETLAGAVGVAILCGVVMSGIPNGGFLGEALIVSLYGFGPEALPIISMLGTLVDAPATMVNSTGDTVASMLITRLLEGKNWLKS